MTMFFIAPSRKRGYRSASWPAPATPEKDLGEVEKFVNGLQQNHWPAQ